MTWGLHIFIWDHDMIQQLDMIYATYVDLTQNMYDITRDMTNTNWDLRDELWRRPDVTLRDLTRLKRTKLLY